MTKEGISGFSTGIKISLIRDVPFSGLFYPVYKQFQLTYASLLGIDPANQTSANIVLLTSLSSFSANIFSCTLTHPIDLIRTRIYFQFYNEDKG